MWKGLKIFAVVSLGLLASGCATRNDAVGSITPYENPAQPADVASEGLPARGPSLPDSSLAVAAPVGFISFCTRFPDQCIAQPDAPSVVTLAAPQWLALEEINKSVNWAIKPMDDKRHYGREEYWNIPTDGFGDCEDYALTKRKRLMAAGFPEPALRLALALDWRNERHAVLTVSTDRGDFVLDNLTDEISSANKSDYEWIERQDPTKQWGWLALGKSPNPVYVASAANGPMGSAP